MSQIRLQEKLAECQRALDRVVRAKANHNATLWDDSEAWFKRKRQLNAQYFGALDQLRSAKLALTKVCEKGHEETGPRNGALIKNLGRALLAEDDRAIDKAIEELCERARVVAERERDHADD